MGCSKSSSKKEVYSNTILPQKKETSQINNLTLYLKHSEEEEQRNPKISRRNHKDEIRNKWERNGGNNSKDQ